MLYAAAGLIALSGLLPERLVGLLRYDRAAVTDGELWRLATAHLVHLGAAHALMNALALVLIGWILRPLRQPAVWAVLVLASALAVSAGLYWLYPKVVWYAGASGALHGLFAGGALLGLNGPDRARGVVLLAALAAKLLWEAGGGGSLFLAGSTTPVLTESHLLGAVAGIVAGLALLARRRRL